MNKLVLVCIAATGICGQSAIAGAAPVNAKPVAYSATGTETPTTSGFETFKFVLSVIGYVGALTAFFVGLAQYKRAD